MNSQTTVQPATSSSAIVSSIRYLTFTLQHCKLTKLQSPAPLKHTSKLRADAAFFAHLATMLNCGYPASVAFAVTGHVDAQGAKATIVVSANSSDSEADKNIDSFSIHAVEPNAALQPEHITSPSMSALPPFSVCDLRSYSD